MSVDVVRDAAVDVLLRVFQRGAYLGIALDKSLARRKLSPQGRRFLTQLVYGVTRNITLCDHALAGLVHQPLEELPLPILMVLRLAVFQSLFCSQVTRPAMVHTSVDLARKRGHAGTARLVNAVLRRAPRSLDEVGLPSAVESPVAFHAVRYSLPEWLVDRWFSQWGPDTAAALCAASNEEAPRNIRVNTLRASAEGLRARLEKAGYGVAATSDVPEELTLTGGKPPARSKLFEAGHFMVQDAASMLPPHLLEPSAGDRVLDMCAAPGGKTTHLAALACGEADVAAMDINAARLGLVRQNAERLGTPRVRLVRGDGTSPPFRRAFDRILVDAPCSGLGTLRRHPDLKWRIRPEAFADLAALQRGLLRSAVEVCKNAGLIVYSVCTFAPEETTDVLKTVLEDGHLVPEDGPQWLSKWKTDTGQYRTLPIDGALDGFYLTRLRKAS